LLNVVEDVWRLLNVVGCFWGRLLKVVGGS